MRLRDDDPIYYRNEIRDLFSQAFDNGVGLDIYVMEDAVRVMFKAGNGDKAELTIANKN